MRTMKPFRDRNPALVGLVGVLVIGLLLAVASQVGRLPVIGSGPTYSADFTEVGGLKKGDDVRLAGVRVGEVTDLELRGNRVRVSFRVKGERDRLDRQTGAAVRIKTLLGTMYVALQPAGSGHLDSGAVIPSSRTTPPYDIVQAFSDLSETTTEIDTDQLAYAMKTLASVTERTPAAFQEAVKGVTALSENLANRDEQIKTLLKNVDGVSGILADRNEEVVRLFRDGGTLFDALAARRDAIHQVLVGVQQMSSELTALITSTRADLKPALDRLAGVVDVLEKNQGNITKAMQQLPAYYAMVATNAGNGPWLDGFLYNLLSILGVPGGL